MPIRFRLAMLCLGVLLLSGPGAMADEDPPALANLVESHGADLVVAALGPDLDLPAVPVDAAEIASEIAAAPAADPFDPARFLDPDHEGMLVLIAASFPASPEDPVGSMAASVPASPEDQTGSIAVASAESEWAVEGQEDR